MNLPPLADRQMVGLKGTVEFAVASKERMGEAWKWWNSADAAPKRMLQVLMKRFIDKGDIQSETAFKHLDGPVWEFKRGSYRILCYRVGQRCLLTNYLMKGGRKNISKDIEKAKRIGEGHLQWEASQNHPVLGQSNHKLKD